MGRTPIFQNLSRAMALIVAFALVLSWAPAARAADTGTCGDGLTWILEAGTLTISGSGAMYDYTESSMAPWYAFRESVVNLVLPSGITHIGDLAFYNVTGLAAVSIPGSVKSIGAYAFAKCTGLKTLSLGRVETIGEAAFSDCYSLTSLDIPSSVTSIGRKAFYRCESISSVTVPSSVTYLGQTVFGYCKSLVTANVQANIQEIPQFLFYGCSLLSTVTLPETTTAVSSNAFSDCDRLETVHYEGDSQTTDQVKDSIGTGNTGFGVLGIVTTDPSTNTATSGNAVTNSDGSITEQNVTVTQGESSSVTSKVENTYQPGDMANKDIDTNITVNVSSGGWEEATNTVNQEIEKLESLVSSTSEGGTIQVDVFLKDETELDPSFVDSLAGKPVTITVTTANGSSWTLDAGQMEPESGSGEYNLSYSLVRSQDNLGGTATYWLQFYESAQVNAELTLRMGAELTNQRATLLQRDDELIKQIQTAVVDRNGEARFYLASVDKDTEYFVVMNLPDADEPVAIPADVLPIRGEPENYQPIKYEITGRTSSWGMNLGQVMGILAVVMVSAIVVIGFVMYSINKRRLAMGYVPDLYGDDE